MEVTPRNKVEVLFEQACKLPGEQRGAFLDGQCGTDAVLRAEVESLLVAAQEAPAFFERLAAEIFKVDEEPKEENKADQIISHYRVLDKLGGGGMGVVYTAEDTRLQRIVALKFLPPALSADEAARVRFEYEARAASALDHPNICTIYEIGETDDGQLFIAMAHYGGETLKKKIKQGALPMDKSFDYAAQMARGLVKAHDQSIVHRDIKPANVIVTDDGVVKILDFGLAKMADVHLTRTGTTMGTIAYMSPEQARGDRVDHRTDVWSLGVVLYEMLTGERPFRGDYEQALIYSVLNEDPAPVSQLNPEVPEEMEHIVTMCLEKEADLRYPQTADLLADLEIFVQGSTTGASMALKAARRRKLRARKKIFAGMGVFVSLLLLLLIPGVRNAVFPSGEPALQRLAVLPFVTIGNVEPAFADGLLHTVTARLTGLEQVKRSLVVIPALDVVTEGVKNTPQADSVFGVDMVIMGSIQLEGDKIRLNLNLVDVATGVQSQTLPFDASVGQTLAFQDDVVRELARVLDVELNPESELILTAGGTTEPRAYDFYIRGRGYLQSFTNESSVNAAIEVLKNAIQADPAYALAYAGLGEAFWRKYRITRDRAWADSAATIAEQALDLNDRLAPVHMTLGLVYAGTGRYGESVQAYRRALEFEPNNAAIYRGLGYAYRREGKPEQAEQSYFKAIEKGPDYWSNYNDLGIFYHIQGRHNEAAEKFERVTELAPDNPWGFNNLGAQYQQLGQPEKAIPWYEKATRVNPSEKDATARAYLNLGSIYYNQDNFVEAIQKYEKALGIEEQDIEVWADLGNAYHWIEEPVKAREAWQRTIELAKDHLLVDPANTLALRYLAFGHAKLGDHLQALAVVYRVLALDQQDGETLAVIARTYERVGKRDSALYYVREALAKGAALAPIEASKWLGDLRATPQYQEIVQAFREENKEAETP